MNESIAGFAKYGYVLLRDAIQPYRLEDLKRHLRFLLKAGDNQTLEGAILATEKRSHKELYEACITVGSSMSAYDLVAGAALRDKAAAIAWGCEWNLHCTPLHIAVQIPRNTDHDYLWHQESSYYPWAPHLLNVWFPVLASTGMATGTISLIPGSHMRGNRNAVKSNEEKFIQIVPELEEAEETKAIAIDADPGDVLFFHADMIHKSLPNVSNVPRVTGVMRIVDMGKMDRPRPLYKALSYVQ